MKTLVTEPISKTVDRSGLFFVPALVLLGGFALHEAVGTSLAIIALNCGVGFFRYRQILDDTGIALDWPVLAAVAAAGVAGSLLGRSIGGRLPGDIPGLYRRGHGLEVCQWP